MRLRLSVLAALSLVLGVAVAASPAWGAQGSRFRPAVSGQLGVVATEAPAAARVGRRALERGGNAVDAAVSTVFALNVARPQSCGIGGGGFMVYRGAHGQTAALDFRETAPQAFTPETLQGPGLHNTFTGHLTVGVPGSEAREIIKVRSVRTSISNCWPIRRMNSSSGVMKRCIGSTTEARKRRVMSEMPSSDIV